MLSFHENYAKIKKKKPNKEKAKKKRMFCGKISITTSLSE